MNDRAKQEHVANLIAALAHLLTGKAENFDAFVSKTEVCVSGQPPVLGQMLSMMPSVEANQRPLFWVHPRTDVIGNLQVGLVSPRLVVENCVLWMAEQDDRATLVPDGFRFGAFKFDDKLVLNYVEEAPMATFDEFVPGIGLAYGKFAEIALDQRDRGERFPLPQHLQAS